MLGWLLLCPALLPVTADPACQDDLYRECGARAAAGECGGGAGQDHELARRALAECRQSCRAVHPAPAPSRLVSLYGGLGDSLHDQFGFQYRLCDPTGGFTSAGRAGALRHHALTRLQPLWVPAFTQRGFQAAPLPVELWRRLETEYKQALSGLVVEQCEPSVINCQVTADLGTECAARQDRRTLLTQLSPALLESVSRTLLPLAEQWAGLKLEHTATYGVRRYNNGSWLSAHVDIFHTHVISAIINLGQAVTEEWPLFILDNDGAAERVLLRPGEMVWYESARAVHGRPQLFNGEYFDNLFVHYRPAGLWYSEPFQLDRDPLAVPLTAEQVRRAQVELGLRPDTDAEIH